MEDNIRTNWYISYDESELLKNKRYPHKLAFALQLKHYSETGTFISKGKDISTELMDHICAQLHTDPSILEDYFWMSSTAKKHRSEILTFLNIERASTTDHQEFRRWVRDNLFPMGIQKDSFGVRLGSKAAPTVYQGYPDGCLSLCQKAEDNR